MKCKIISMTFTESSIFYFQNIRTAILIASKLQIIMKHVLSVYWYTYNVIVHKKGQCFTSIISIALSVPASKRSNSECSISLVVGFTIYLSPTRPTRTPAIAFDIGTSESALEIKLLRLIVLNVSLDIFTTLQKFVSRTWTVLTYIL